MSECQGSTKRAIVQGLEEEFLAVFPRTMVVSEPAYRNWLSVGIKKWPMDMQERISKMKNLVFQTEIANVDPRVKAVARYCWRRLKEDYPEHATEDGLFR